MSENNLKQQTFSGCVEQFLFDRKSKNRAKKTIQFYESELRYFSDWLTKNNLPSEIERITSTTIKTYLIDLSKHRNKGGVHCSYRVIKAFMNFYDFEFEPAWKNPIKKVKIKPNNLQPLPEIPLEDVQKLINACEGHNKNRDISILKTLVDTGVRASELVALNIGDVDLITGSTIIHHGKGDKARIVWLGEKGRKALKTYLKERNELLATSPLFLNEDGNRLKFFGLRQVVVRLCNRVGLPENGLHAFRRCFALSLYRKGVDILTISRLLGHSNLVVTTRYLNIGNEDLKEKHSKASPADSLD